MSITDELREFAPHLNLGKVALAGWKESLLSIADRIDAEHDAKVAYWQGASYKDGYDEGLASADDWLAQHEDAMSEHGFVRLPVDANGMPIRVGDVMEWPDGSTAEVVGIGHDTFFYVEDGEGAAEWSCASDKIHHHEPTVEDVLREFACTLTSAENNWGSDVDDAITEYAAKLQLKEDE